MKNGFCAKFVFILSPSLANAGSERNVGMLLSPSSKWKVAKSVWSDCYPQRATLVTPKLSRDRAQLFGSSYIVFCLPMRWEDTEPCLGRY